MALTLRWNEHDLRALLEQRLDAASELYHSLKNLFPFDHCFQTRINTEVIRFWMFCILSTATRCDPMKRACGSAGKALSRGGNPPSGIQYSQESHHGLRPRVEKSFSGNRSMLARSDSSPPELVAMRCNCQIG